MGDSSSWAGLELPKLKPQIVFTLNDLLLRFVSDELSQEPGS
jgi:hypothetical protein